MLPTHRGSFRLFRFAGIDVFLHWLWFVVAIYEIQDRAHLYTSFFWNIAEYLSLFGIVLLHEFGHAFACRQVGGVAKEIVLWPLGGVAYVQPPPRPGALLWSVAAGPLVNALLIPVFLALGKAVQSTGLGGHDFAQFIHHVALLNVVLLVFNLLPVYPLDGGQILQALLWFVIGRAWSLLMVSITGALAAAGLLVAAIVKGEKWFGIIAIFVILRCWVGFQHFRIIRRSLNADQYEGVACPSCGAHPPQGTFWMCPRCVKPFDTFANQATCPSCGTQFTETSCPECHVKSPMRDWLPATT